MCFALRVAVLLGAFSSFIPSPAFAAEKAVGTPCSGNVSAADFDTVANCQGGTMQPAAPFRVGGIALGSSTQTPGAVADLSADSSSMLLPRGSTAQRPSCTASLAGSERFNTDLHQFEGCDGSAWNPFRPTGGPPGSGYFALSNGRWFGNLSTTLTAITHSGTTATAAAAGTTGLNTGDTITESGAAPTDYNGTFTITVLSPTSFQYTMATTPTSNATTLGTYAPSYGGLTLANQICLGELTSNTGWFGHNQASTEGRLNAAHVKAYLCDGSACQGPTAGATYYFSSVADATAGSATMSITSTGTGPGDAASWASAAHFGGQYSNPMFWTGRAAGGGTAWATTSATSTCTGWTSNSSSIGGQDGNVTGGGSARWTYTAPACTSLIELVCMVNP